MASSRMFLLDFTGTGERLADQFNKIKREVTGILVIEVYSETIE